MSDITLAFNGRTYRLACAPGQEDRLLALARDVKARLEAMLAEHGAVGDDRLLLMLAVELTDRLWDAEAERDSAIARADAVEKAAPRRAEPKAGRRASAQSAPPTGEAG
jgi:cell division protein ZapA